MGKVAARGFLVILMGVIASLPAFALTLPLNGSSSGSLSPSHTSDTWSVTTTSDGALVVNIVAAAGLELDVNLYDTNGTTVIAMDHGNGVSSSVSVSNLKPGTYYVTPYYYSGSAGSYTIGDTFTPNSLANDTEPNDTFAQAQALGPNATTTGHIGYYSGGVTDSADWFKVATTADGSLTLTLTQDRGGDVVDVNLYDTNGTTELGRSHTSGSVEAITIPNLRPGTYYFAVYLYTGFCGYTVQSQFTPNPLANDVEPNDTAAQAQTVALGASATGHIGYYSGGTSDSVDWFKVATTADGSLTMTVTQDRGGDAVDVNLYDTNGSSEIGRSHSTSSVETITIPNLRPGTYYLAVYLYTGFCGYTVQSQFTPQPLANDTEPNDTLQTAQRAFPDQPRTGHLGYYSSGTADSLDWFKVVLPADGNLWLEIVSDSTTDIDMELYDANGGEIARDHQVGPHSHLGKDGITAGVYYLRMYAYAGYGGYTITPAYSPQYVNLLGLRQIIPGEDVIYTVRWFNPLSTPLTDAVVRASIPLEIGFKAYSAGGTYFATTACQNQVFWKLGTLVPGQSGIVTFTLQVPWGTPYADTEIKAALSASNMDSPPFDVAPYLAFTPNEVVSELELTAGDVSALLASRPEVQTLVNAANQAGYLFFGTAVQVGRADATEAVRLYLVGPAAIPAVITSTGGRAFGEIFQDGVYSVFDATGGFTWDQGKASWTPWGSWASSAMGEDYAPGVTGLREAQCQFNCTINSLPEVAAKKVSDIYANLKFSDNCIQCALSIEQGHPNEEKCSKCTATGAKKFSKTVAANVPLIGDAVSWGWAVKKCFDDCQADPTKHICSGEKRDCSTSVLGWLGGFDTVKITPCNTHLGIYGLVPGYINCAYGDSCYNGQCGAKPPCNGSSCMQKPVKVRASHDPNAKSSDHSGDVIPGQRITYTLQYENTGGGTALGVFLLDTLDTSLDEATLIINDGGAYTQSVRVLEWDVGDVPAGGKGSVTFSVQVKAAVVPGTQIVNQASVYFPSALEVTPTNAVVHTVAGLSADPKSVEGLSGAAIPVTLSGQKAGGGSVGFVVTSSPLYGTLSGTAPLLTYISMAQFTGPDEFYYAATNGLSQSAPAKVSVTVNPNPADTTPPLVIATVPAANATKVHVDPTPVSTSPPQYIPFITAAFTEDVDDTTVSVSSFTVDGVTGTVLYDGASRTATFIPGVPLANATTYTAHLSTAIKDRAGNYLASPYSWHFTTESAVSIEVGLPFGATALSFPGTQVYQTSPSQTVSIASAGSQNLSVGTLSITGTDHQELVLSADNCSGKLLTPGQTCTFKVSFSPTAMGARTATLIIPSNDPVTPTVQIPLSGTGAASPCSLSCSATVPATARAGVAVAFSATSTPTGCSQGVSYDWNFGDGTSHASGASPSHTYTSAGSFTWTMTASADGVTCTRSGSITLSAPCTLDCSASAPSSAYAQAPVSFQSTVTTSNCSDGPYIDWDFGDSSTHTSSPSPTHTYNTAGNYTWRFTVVAGSQSCTKSGTIAVANPVPPPVIALIKKASPPFKLVVTGSNLQRGIRVFIDGTEFTSVVWKNTGKIQLTGTIKTVVPKGTTHTFRFLNPDGGEASTTWGW